MKLNRLLLSLLVSACAMNAATLFNNLSYGSGSDDYVTSNNHNGPLADSFSTGAPGFTFSSLSLSLQSIDPSNPGTVTVSLNSDSPAGPDMTLYTLGTVSDSSLTTLNSTVVLNSFGNIYLAADTRYWIQLSDSVGSSISWQYATGNAGVGAANESYYYGGNVFPNSDGPYLMSVDGTTGVPEPATFAIALIGFGLVAASKLKRS